MDRHHKSGPGGLITQDPSRSKHLNIIGVSFGYHDSACCLLQDGVLTAAAQEERFTRVKHDRSFPRRAFRYCLEQAGISISDVACIGYYEEPEQKLSRQVWMSLMPGLSDARREALLLRMQGGQPVESIRRTLGYEGPVEVFDHHLSHAASSYYFSGFDEAAVLTVDGVGDWATTTYGAGEGERLVRFEQVDFPDSLGLLYSTITGFLGFEVNDGEYKVMGLAPYGEPLYVEQLRRLVELREDGQYRLDTKYFAFLTEDRMYSEPLMELLGHPPREPESELQQFHKDLAKSLQVVLEEVLLEKARYLHGKFPSENLCMAGGVALNCVANSRLLRDGPFKRLFVQPAAGDAGGALGAAALAHVRLTKEAPVRKRLEHAYLGPAFTSEQAHQVLSSSSATFRDFRGREGELIEFTAAELARGKVVGWFQGRMEFGPRSLGARSILADPRGPRMRDRINALVKMREAFRPFAPAILEEEAQNHFQLDHPSPFMLETCQVISELELPAITHVDGSARVQTVDAATNPRFAALLREFFKRTGCPILLNTSFNMRGEPIVCNVVDAVACFVRSKLNLLVVEDMVIDRAGIPLLWELFASRGGGAVGGESISSLVYTLL
jgi:carbamoyltransferase